MVRSVSLACVLALAACGERRPRPDLVKPSVIVPAPDALHVGVLLPITVDYSGPLQPDLVTIEHVGLMTFDATAPLPATVEYDADAHRITLRPAAPLAYGARYRLQITGLVSEYGEPVADVSSSFTALFNSMLTERGGMTVPSTSTLDALGRPAQRVELFPGPDGLVGTADDEKVWCSTFGYDEVGISRWTTLAPGPDLTCFTIDDQSEGYTVSDVSVAGRRRTTAVNSPGPDTFWLTPDDGIQRLEQLDFEARGRDSRNVTFSSLGIDGRPFTIDDSVSFYEQTTWVGESGRLVKYDGPGPDATWFTGDDLWAGVTEIECDPAGRVLRRTEYLGTGLDRIWRTDDDYVFQRDSYSYDARGLLSELRSYSGPGADEIWGTADDPLISSIRFTYDAAGARLTSETYYCVSGKGCQSSELVLGIERTFEPSL